MTIDFCSAYGIDIDENFKISTHGRGWMISYGRREYFVFASLEDAEAETADYWNDLAENDPEELKFLVGTKTLIQWGRGKYAGPGYAKARSLQEWIDDIASQYPEEHFASYDGNTIEISESDFRKDLDLAREIADLGSLLLDFERGAEAREFEIVEREGTYYFTIVFDDPISKIAAEWECELGDEPLTMDDLLNNDELRSAIVIDCMDAIDASEEVAVARIAAEIVDSCGCIPAVAYRAN